MLYGVIYLKVHLCVALWSKQQNHPTDLRWTLKPGNSLHSGHVIQQMLCCIPTLRVCYRVYQSIPAQNSIESMNPQHNILLLAISSDQSPIQKSMINIILGKSVFFLSFQNESEMQVTSHHYGVAQDTVGIFLRFCWLCHTLHLIPDLDG